MSSSHLAPRDDSSGSPGTNCWRTTNTHPRPNQRDDGAAVDSASLELCVILSSSMQSADPHRGSLSSLHATDAAAERTYATAKSVSANQRDFRRANMIP